MNLSTLARNYGSLTAEERFRLILAASARADEAERDRLVKAGPRIVLSMPDHSPYAHAFSELAQRVYVELLEAAAYYLDAFDRADEARAIFGDDDDAEDKEPEGNADNAAAEQPTVWLRLLDLALVAGYVLGTKADGWNQFCERINVPPHLLWEGMPGFERLQGALALAAKAAFVPEGMQVWLNRMRPAGEAELTEIPLTVERVADATAERFRRRIKWWGG